MVRLGIATPTALIAAGALILSSCSPSPSDSSPTLSPSTSPTPSATPTVEPTPIVSSWIGLNWSDPVAPFPSASSWITDMIQWGDGYVGVGGTAPPDSGLGTVFASADGLHWSITFQANLPQGWYFEHVVPLGEGMLAVSNQRGISCPANTSPCPPAGADLTNRLWYSNDGATWTQIDSPSWRAAWGTDAGSLGEVVGGREGAVAVALSGDVVVHSTDGQTWKRIDGLPAVTGAIIRDLAAYPGGFVIVGRDGEPDPFSQVGPQPPPGIGRPAAWVSADGVTWIAATVPGSDVAGGELRAVAAGGNGLFATGIMRPIQDAFQAAATGWASVDGRTWRVVGELGADLPDTELLVGDGVHMVILGSESPGSPTLAASVSSDGAAWTRLNFSGATSSLPGIRQWNPPSGVSLFLAYVMSDGVIVDGAGTIPLELWFGTAIGP